MHKSLVDHRRLVAALNRETAPGTFRSVPLGLGDVRTIERKEFGRWQEVADTDDLMELAKLARWYLSECASGPFHKAVTAIREQFPAA